MYTIYSYFLNPLKKFKKNKKLKSAYMYIMASARTVSNWCVRALWNITEFSLAWYTTNSQQPVPGCTATKLLFQNRYSPGTDWIDCET